MAYEFKKISNVEVVAEPTETANVLIEENGVIKKAPKTAVGGNDFIRIIDNGENAISCNYTYDEIVSMIESFNAIALVTKVDLTYYGNGTTLAEEITLLAEDGAMINDKANAHHIYFGVGYGYYKLYKDNTIEYVDTSIS